MGTDPRANPRFTEDLPLEATEGPAVYRHTTDKPVRYLVIANERSGVIGYVWANDADEAAGWEPRPAAGGDAFNGGRPWLMSLRDARARALAPTRALAEMLEAAESADTREAGEERPGSEATGAVVPGSLADAPSLAALRELAAHD
ncbi:MAG TPA: hypothetical protein DEQ61_01295 [Streptomyces sp.]|nr:hypothetical protein [Streptomyces sp.]